MEYSVFNENNDCYAEAHFACDFLKRQLINPVKNDSNYSELRVRSAAPRSPNKFDFFKPGGKQQRFNGVSRRLFKDITGDKQNCEGAHLTLPT